jgi:hypothetical protein
MCTRFDAAPRRKWLYTATLKPSSRRRKCVSVHDVLPSTKQSPSDVRHPRTTEIPLAVLWPKPVSSTCWDLLGSFFGLVILGLGRMVDRGRCQFRFVPSWCSKRPVHVLALCGAAVDPRHSILKPITSQALRVVIVVHLLLASPGLCTLGRTLVILATALSIVSLGGIVGLRGAGVLQTLRVVVVLFLADERLLALGASGVVLAAALAVQSLGRTVCRNLAVRLGWCFACCSSGLIGGHAEGC